jgi:Carboxylesterase family
MFAFQSLDSQKRKLVLPLSKMHSLLRCLSVVATGLALVRATPSVTIPAGTIHGTTCSNGASAFFSIPFAVPPVGSLRWTSPQAYNQTFPANGFDATTKGAICIQFGSEFTDPGEASEDWYLSLFLRPYE